MDTNKEIPEITRESRKNLERDGVYVIKRRGNK